MIAARHCTWQTELLPRLVGNQSATTSRFACNNLQVTHTAGAGVKCDRRSLSNMGADCLNISTRGQQRAEHESQPDVMKNDGMEGLRSTLANDAATSMCQTKWPHRQYSRQS